MIGQEILHYKILAKLGEGGMGVVYQAEDMKLKREVAIKFLPRHIAASAEERERFKIEAQAAAALNHPNIATIHAIEEVDDEMFIVMEFIEGEELKKKASSDQLSVDSVINLTTQIAEGLKAAHAKGIIHRDIKSSNIMVTESGQVKIMDFGIAKFLEASGRAALLTKSGTTLGTAAYMSPEQARGEEVDQRTDIWSLGIVLYEMIAGQLPFQGVYDQAILYAIVNEEPEPLSRHRPEVPASLQRVVDKALDKAPQTRYQHVEELLADLQQERKSTSTAVESSTIKKSPSTKFMLAATAIIFTALVIVSFYFIKQQPAISVPPTHTKITFVGNASDPAISSDGKFIAYVSGKIGEQKLLVQELAGGKPLEIFSGARCLSPRWSPDGSELLLTATFKDSSTRTILIPRLGGSFRQLPPPYAALMCWSPDGSRIAMRNSDDSEKLIWLIDKNTFEKTSIRLDGSFTWVRGLDWSPSGQRLLFLTVKKDEHYEIGTIKVDGSEQREVVEDSVGLFSPRWSGHDEAIYYLRDAGQSQNLMKVQTSAATGKGQAVPRILQSGLQTGAALMLSQDNKRALYTRAIGSSNLWLANLDGTEGEQIVKPKQITTGTSSIYAPAISPEGKSVAFSIQEGKHANIFVMPLAGGTMQQLTFLNSSNVLLDWSPDGREIVFGSDHGGKTRVWRVNASGGTPRPFEKSELSGDAPAVFWSPGAQILYQRTGSRNFYILDPRTEAEKPLVSNDSVGWMFFPRYSPDGKNVAVHWNRWEAHKSLRGVWRISLEDSSQILLAKGEFFPLVWSADGTWIYYWDPGKRPVEIIKIPASGGKPKRHAVLTFENAVQAYVGSMTPDGRKIVCFVIETQSDVWLMEDFDPEIVE